MPFLPKDKTAENGCWRQGPGKDFINAIKDRFGDPHIIAEDLGFLTKEVKDLLQMSGFPGMKVLQFAFDARESNNYLPYTYVSKRGFYIMGKAFEAGRAFRRTAA